MKNPVFVRGYSRSGGTLLVTLLDAHRNIAMSYEQYPNMLFDGDKPLTFRELGDYLAKYKAKGDKSDVPEKVKTFVKRWARSGLSIDDLVGSFDSLVDGNAESEMSIIDALEFIALGAEIKMEREHALRWGMKCNNSYKDYLTAFPEAKFLNITRDCRDVASSQLNTGSFNKTAEEIAKGWVQTYRKFEAFATESPDHCMQVPYEALAENPDEYIDKICEFLGEPIDPRMKSHNEQDLTIFKVNHLSGKRINKPVDTSQIGRWKKDLNESHIEAIDEVAGELLQQLGYK